MEMELRRFDIMAVFQAARAYLLGLSLPEAYSFGLQRAIIYAHWKFHRGTKKELEAEEAAARKAGVSNVFWFSLGNEKALATKQGDVLVFVVSGRPVTAEEFERKIINRMGKERFQKLWEAMLEYLKKHSKEVLEDQRRSYQLYAAIRDAWRQKF